MPRRTWWPSPACLRQEAVEVGVIGRRTELVLIPAGPGRMRIVSPHELALGEP